MVNTRGEGACSRWAGLAHQREAALFLGLLRNPAGASSLVTGEPTHHKSGADS